MKDGHRVAWPLSGAASSCGTETDPVTQEPLVPSQPLGPIPRLDQLRDLLLEESGRICLLGVCLLPPITSPSFVCVTRITASFLSCG